MSEPARHRMTQDAFFAWHVRQERRYELIDGVPVAMAGVKRRHDQVVINALISIGGQVGVGPCRTFTADTAVRIPMGNIRYPDLGVDCGRFIDDAMAADAPALVMEVLSDSTRTFDMVGKLEEYKSVPSLRHIVLVDTDAPTVLYWSRQAGQVWDVAALEGGESEIRMADLGVALPFRVLYNGIVFRPKPRLVIDEAAAG